jgi:hypothetical protein
VVSSITVDPCEMLAVTAHGDGRIVFWDLIATQMLDDLPTLDWSLASASLPMECRWPQPAWTG